MLCLMCQPQRVVCVCCTGVLLPLVFQFHILPLVEYKVFISNDLECSHVLDLLSNIDHKTRNILGDFGVTVVALRLRLHSGGVISATSGASTVSVIANVQSCSLSSAI
jgi:hypothetical protein